jgi:hypothetical protein
VRRRRFQTACCPPGQRLWPRVRWRGRCHPSRRPGQRARTC